MRGFVPENDFKYLQAAIRRELNVFKSTEMPVHEGSKHLTRFDDDDDDGAVVVVMMMMMVATTVMVMIMTIESIFVIKCLYFRFHPK